MSPRFAANVERGESCASSQTLRSSANSWLAPALQALFNGQAIDPYDPVVAARAAGLPRMFVPLYDALVRSVVEVGDFQ